MSEYWTPLIRLSETQRDEVAAILRRDALFVPRQGARIEAIFIQVKVVALGKVERD